MLILLGFPQILSHLVFTSTMVINLWERSMLTLFPLKLMVWCGQMSINYVTHPWLYFDFLFCHYIGNVHVQTAVFLFWPVLYCAWKRNIEMNLTLPSEFKWSPIPVSGNSGNPLLLLSIPFIISARSMTLYERREMKGHKWKWQSDIHLSYRQSLFVIGNQIWNDLQIKKERKACPPQLLQSWLFLRYYSIDPGKFLSCSITTQNLILIDLLNNQKIIYTTKEIKSVYIDINTHFWPHLKAQSGLKFPLLMPDFGNFCVSSSMPQWSR